MTENKIILLKTGETIQILDIYPDYLTDKKYVVYRHQNQMYISDYEQLKLHIQPLYSKKEQPLKDDELNKTFVSCLKRNNLIK